MPADTTYLELEFDTPQTINEEVRILAVADGEVAEADGAYIGYERDDVKPDEFTTHRIVGAFGDSEAFDTAYRYTWEPPFTRRAKLPPAFIEMLGY
ncbi:unnamed protein product [marine sediment metagenome]|uniref:Uncharacterized protein n=1 Tax=marine sediment metagenome TaxID=412755 RepID=X1RXK1_9ZZZZ